MSGRNWLFAAMLALVSAPTAAAEAIYIVDPGHTYPSFEADHMGMSLWRGKFNKTTGKVTLDKEAGKGDVEIVIDLDSIDFGHDELNGMMSGPKFFDTDKHPKATYKGKLAGFVDGAPTQVVGDLTLRGVTRPVTLKINSFKCMPHPMSKRDWCGADALATINREEFGMDEGKAWGFDMDVVLRIQVEAEKAE
ncbi:MAG TPA: YceI family protein [Lysobacter sp.]